MVLIKSKVGFPPTPEPLVTEILPEVPVTVLVVILPSETRVIIPTVVKSEMP